MDSTSFQHVSIRLKGAGEGGWGQMVLTSLFNKIEQMLKQMLKLFAPWALTLIKSCVDVMSFFYVKISLL